MEALAAVGLAGNILGFIDFAFKLLTTTRTIYRSASGTTPEYCVIDTIARHVEDHCDKLAHTHGTSPQFSAVVEESSKIARELQSHIQKVREKATGSKWNSFMLALREVMNKSEVAALVERLSSLNKQITAHLLQSMLDRQTRLVEEFGGISDEIKTRGVRFDNVIASVRQDLEKAVNITQTILEKWEERNGETHCEAITSLDIGGFSLSLDAPNDFISYYALQSNSGNLISHYQTTKSLEFDEIRSREGQIDKAHIDTFLWVLDRSPEGIGFVQWLENGNSTYWIQGKAGAGKSTLMKYICDQPMTYEYLDRWADGQLLITAKYFSWFAGTNLQKSQEGLLRTLLFNIVTKHPRLLGDLHLLENDDVKYALRKGHFDSRTLAWLILRLIEKTPTIKYCFFIDGLDEFSEPHADLIDIINSLATHNNVKLCLSSRPLNQFADAYGEDTENQLKVESLTQKDIQSFVADKLSAHRSFRMKGPKGLEYQKLVMRPVERSSGVFLWVVLIVRSLLEGLTNGDSIEYLERRLAEFPNDLRDFLKFMLGSVDQRYRKETAEAFRIALVYEDAIPLILFSALFTMNSDLDWPINLRCDPHTRDEILSIHEEAHRQLDTRCKGLLEVIEPSQDLESHTMVTVHWLHRCVRDFLKSSEEMKEILGVEMKDGKNARLLICGAYLGVTKWLPNYEEEYTLSNAFERIVFHPFCKTADKLYRRELDPLGVSVRGSDVETLHAVILELERTLQERWPACYTRLAYRALELDWEEYIEYRMEVGSPILTHIKGQLLGYTVGCKGRDPNLGVMKILLDHEANPNEQLRAGPTHTPWTTALTRYMWEKDKLENEKKKPVADQLEDIADKLRVCELKVFKIVGAIQLLAKFGADPNAPIPNRHFPEIPREITARELIENHVAFPELQDIELKQTAGWFSVWLGRLWSWQESRHASGFPTGFPRISLADLQLWGHSWAWTEGSGVASK
ncbi:hypothetical protein NUW58_g2103 [Xylaria curta]|uniref:Uncharacterized protein n=1 Tax=Xylaria curta TaxID=42375 RepID=A0ACC1PIW9_9PEZI|nr:hypothetical protein NUW58_g2103 [Xylaria curta]